MDDPPGLRAVIISGVSLPGFEDGRWRAWAQELTATRLPGGHFTPEEAPRELSETLAAFLDREDSH